VNAHMTVSLMDVQIVVDGDIAKVLALIRHFTDQHISPEQFEQLEAVHSGILANTNQLSTVLKGV
jgi:hypothetical protein